MRDYEARSVKGSSTKNGPLLVQTNAALALRGCSSDLTPAKCLKGLPNKREADSMDGEGCFKNLLWAVSEQQKASMHRRRNRGGTGVPCPHKREIPSRCPHESLRHILFPVCEMLLGMRHGQLGDP